MHALPRPLPLFHVLLCCSGPDEVISAVAGVRCGGGDCRARQRCGQVS